MKFLHIAGVLALGFFLSGCESDHDKADALREILEQASHATSPYEGAMLLQDAHLHYYPTDYAKSNKNWDEVQGVDIEIRRKRDDLLVQSIQQNDIRGAKLVFKSSADDASRRAASAVLAHADKADASAQWLELAGDLTFEGGYTPTDYERSFNYLARAWQQGDISAASTARSIFVKLGDRHNLYLWQLRCMNECGFYMDEEKINLSPKEMISLQKMATQKTALLADGDYFQIYQPKPNNR